MNNYTKQGFINGDFVLINDDSEELERLINSWFPDDLFKTSELRNTYKFVVFSKGRGQWFLDGSVINRPAIKASEITEERIITGSELEVCHNGKWVDANKSLKYRFKPKPDPRISEMMEEAKKMGFNLTFEKI